MAIGSIRIFSPLGIPIRLHYSWWLIFFPVLFTLAYTIYPQFYPTLPRGEIWTMAGLTTGLLFVSLLLHEFGHAVAARRFGIPVHSVELFVFGGVARMVGFTRRPRDEFILAGSGPAVSLVFALAVGALYLVLNRLLGIRSPLVDVALHAGAFNLATVAFNLIPAYPLDGGRVLQGLIWHFNRRRAAAAMVPAIIGAVLALALVGFGAFQISRALQPDGAFDQQQQFISGVWPILIGVFIAWAARRSYRGVCVLDRISDMMASEALDGRVQPVTAGMDLSAARGVAFPEPGIVAAPILDPDGRATAVLLGDEMDEAPAGTLAGELATDIPCGLRVVEAMDLFDAMIIMARAQKAWLVVEDAEGRYVGMLTQASLRWAFRNE